MSIYNDEATALLQYIALMAGSTALAQNDENNASLLGEMAKGAYKAYRVARGKREGEERVTKYDRIVQGWSEDVPYARKRNPREKQFVHRVSIAMAPDTEWLVENIRVPFVFEFEGEQIIYATRCPREAVAVKMRWG